MAKWTNQQRRAIEEEGNLLVAAGAGAGKTAVLTARIVERIRAGTPVRAFLVVTFTRAAAGEMKKRVARSLLETAADEADAAARARLEAAAEEVQNASISTLHAFCAQLLRRHFYRVELDPAFGVADEAEAALLREDAMEELFTRRAEEADFAALCDALGGEERLAAAILEIHAFMQAQVGPRQWLEEAVERYAHPEGLGDSALGKSVLAGCKRALRAAVEAMEEAGESVRTAHPAAADFARAETEALGALLDLPYGDYAKGIQAFAFARLTGFARGTPEAEKQGFKAARERLRDMVKAQKKRLARPLAQEEERMRAFLPYLQTLRGCVLEMEGRYARLKRARALVDYADMEQLSLALLANADVREEYRRRFQYILVDEYQDSNRVQEAILSALKRGDNLFMVGDVKQSIYRFRLAEPALFTEKYEDPARFSLRVVDLNRNFRSARAVVDMVNLVFSASMRGGFGGPDYDARAALVFGRPDESAGEARFCLLDAPGEEDDFETAASEARFCARQIREIMEKELYTDPQSGKPRPYRYSDFAILHRSPRGVAERMVQTLAQAGIPAWAERSGGYFEAAEVQVFLNLLRLVDNRRQSIPLLSVMRSAIGGFTDEELARLRVEAEADAEWADIVFMAARREDALGKKTAAFLDRLDGWHEESRLLGLSELCAALLDESGYGVYCAALPGGRLRRANLEAMLGRARLYEKGRAVSLSGFIAFMDRMHNTDAVGAAPVLGMDAVRLISIHRSKGLEFPVVLVTGLSKGFNPEEKRADLTLHPALGIGCRLREGAVRLDSLPRQAILEENAYAALEEELRILYVAMTRARDRLVLLMSAKIPLEAILSHARPLTAAACANARCAGDWVLSALLSRPEGNALRAAAGLVPVGGTALANIRCTLEGNAASPGAQAGAPDGQAARKRLLDAAAAAQGGAYDALLRWEYPYLAQTRLPGKVSVSELTGNYRSLRPYPDFIAKERAVEASGRGTAAHLVMESIACKAQSEAEVRAHIDALIESGRLRRAEGDAVNAARVAQFFSSPLGKRLCAAQLVERERQFNQRVSARKLGLAPLDEPVLLQGVIDCCFLEDGAWVILDYKTDYVPPGRSGAEAAKKHEKQLAIYAAALEALTGTPVKEAYIHLLHTGESVRMPLG